MLEVLAIAAVVHAVQPVHPGHSNRYQGTRNIAGCPMPVTRTDDVHRPGFNGRLWHGHAIIGGTPSHHASCAQPGALAYGARDHGQVVLARVGHLSVGISPWQRWNDESFPRYEAARQQWLREQGYTGGVRTLMNDLAHHHPAHEHGHAAIEGDAPVAPREIRPLFIIPIPEDATRLRQRMQVDASQVREALDRAGASRQLTTVVRPATVLPAVVADAR